MMVRKRVLQWAITTVAQLDARWAEQLDLWLVGSLAALKVDWMVVISVFELAVQWAV